MIFLSLVCNVILPVILQPAAVLLFVVYLESPPHVRVASPYSPPVMMQLYKDYPSSLSACFSLSFSAPVHASLCSAITLLPHTHPHPLLALNFSIQSLLILLILLLVFHNLPRLFHVHLCLCLSLSLARFRWSLAQQQWQFRVQHPQLGPLPSAGGSAHRPLEGVGEVEGAVCNPNKGERGGGVRDGEAGALNVAPYEVKGRSQHRSVQWNLSLYVPPWPRLHL